MKKLIIIATIGMTTPFMAQADTAALASSEASAPAFESVDADKDGMITREEASAFSALEITFDNVDSNKDGALDASEFSNSRQSGDSK